MHKNNRNYNVSWEKYSMHLYVNMKEENLPIKTCAAIYMHYNFGMKKILLLVQLLSIKPWKLILQWTYMERKKKYYFRCQCNMTPTLSSLMMVT